MSKFLVLYLVPPHVMDAWAKTDPAIRAPADQKMKRDWDLWINEHAAMVELTVAAGKTKAVTTAGIVERRNDILLYSLVEAASHEAAAQAFAQHPHLSIPEASIEVMAVRSL